MIDDRTLRALEFHRVLERLAGHAASGAGRNACLAIRPADDPDAARRAAELLDEAATWCGLSGALAGGSGTDAAGFAMTDFPDCSDLVDAMERQGAVPDADALFALRTVLSVSSRLATSIRRHADLCPRLAEPCAGPMPDGLAADLNRCIDDDGGIRDTASPRLSGVRAEIRAIHQGCLRKAGDIAARCEVSRYMRDDFLTLSNDRYVLPVKTGFKNRVEGVIHGHSNTGETCYVEPMPLLALNNRLQELKRDEREEERRIVAMLAARAMDELAPIRNAWTLLVGTDVLLAKLRWAEATGSAMVAMDEDAPVALANARHPLLLTDPAARGTDGPHPLTIALRRTDRALIITGGNAGGKTVCLKTLGLACAMTLAGIPFPADRGSSLPGFSDVHAFIGDEQSLSDRMSTFTAQIAALAGLWPGVSDRSLVLLDEFGAGTDPSQGAALAQAVIDGLTEHGAVVAAATHFPALKTYALTRDHVRAASVLFDAATGRPLFTVAYDQVGSSLALDVAREHGLPDEVLRRAERYLLLDGRDTAAVTDRLNRLAAERERELADLREARRKADEAKARCRARLEETRAALERDVRNKAAELMRAWQAGKTTARQAMKELAAVRERLAPEPATAPAASADPAALEVGAEAMHAVLGKRVVVRELDLRQGRAKVELNGLSMWTDTAGLTPCAKDAAPARPRGGVLVRTVKDDAPLLRIDVRGRRAEEAVAEIRRFLDRSLLAGSGGAEIVHGRGTGALRREIHALLKTFPGIASYAVANEDNGGDGVTVVTFA